METVTNPWSYLPEKDQVNLWRLLIKSFSVLIFFITIAILYIWYCCDVNKIENERYIKIIEHPENIEKLDKFIISIEKKSKLLDERIEKLNRTISKLNSFKETEKERLIEKVLANRTLYSAHRKEIITCLIENDSNP